MLGLLQVITLAAAVRCDLIKPMAVIDRKQLAYFTWDAFVLVIQASSLSQRPQT